MDYARHDASLRQRTDDGVTRRAHLEASAAKGSVASQAALAGPEFPDDLEYLWLWILELHGRSGVNMAGLNPLTYTTIRDWSVLTGQYPDADEVQALMALDSVLLNPEPAQSGPPEPTPPQAWPEKRDG